MLDKDEAFDKVSLEQAIKDTGKEANVKGKVLFMSTRIATTGDMHGPSLPVSLSLLGRNIVLKRLTQTIDILGGNNA